MASGRELSRLGGCLHRVTRWLWLSGMVALVGCGSAGASENESEVESESESEVEVEVESESEVEVEVGFRGRLARTEPIFEGEALVVPRATICIPPEAGDARPMPLLYALDGDYFLDELDLCGVVASLVDEGAIDPWVVVSVGSTERRTEQLASRPDRLARTIVRELEPLVAREVRLASGRGARAVVGYSYGGLAAIRFALARPDDFGRVVAMSPSLWFAHRSTLRELRRSQAALPLRLYLDAGSLEGDPGETVPYMIADIREYAAAARTRGMHDEVDLRIREIEGHPHDMALARTRLPDALRFALAR